MSAKRRYSMAFPATMSIGMGAGAGAGAGSARAYKGVRSKPKYRKAAKVSKSVRSYVKRALRADEELKVVPGVGLVAQYVTPTIGIISSPGNAFGLLPKLLTGVTQGERIGNEVRPKAFNVKGVINLSGKVNQAWNVRVRVMIVEDRSILDASSSTAILAALDTQLLMDQGGAGATVGYTGSLAQHFLPINTDRYKVFYDAEFPLSAPVGQTSQQSPLIAGAMASMPPNSSRAFDITVKLPAKLRYDDGSGASGFPTNSAPLMLIGWCNPDEPNIYSSNGPVPLYVTATSKLIYSDA